MIYVYPIEGLANRLRVVASAIVLSKKMDKKLIVIWKRNASLNASFYTLFKKNDAFKLVQHNFLFDIVFYNGSNNFYSFISNLFKWLLQIDFVLDDLFISKYIWKINDLNYSFSVLQNYNKKNLAIKTCHDFENVKLGLNYLNPSNTILEYFNKVRTPENMIGIHIRRSDNLVSIRYSPLSLFLEKIDFEISINPAVKFYLSTDDSNIGNTLCKKYPNNILFNNKILDRNSELGIIDAYLDMLYLATTVKIYGSYFSSFSEIASKLGNVELEILKINE